MSCNLPDIVDHHHHHHHNNHDHHHHHVHKIEPIEPHQHFHEHCDPPVHEEVSQSLIFIYHKILFRNSTHS